MVPWGRVIMSMTATDYLPVRLIGLGCLVVTALGWGLNWPATKFLLEQCPPLTARGLAGVVAGLALAGIAAARGENLAVPPRLRLRLVASALLNVSAWMGLTTLSLLWLNAGEAATLAYTMPVWAALLAWPILGEQLGLYRIVALLLGISGVAVLLGGNLFHAEIGQAAGRRNRARGSRALCSGHCALQTLAARHGSYCDDSLASRDRVYRYLLAASLVLEHPHLLEMHWFGWAALTYTAVVSLGICYLMWFAALRRLDASTAAIGTLLTPIVGVLASAIALGEPLLFPQFASLALVVSGIVLAVRQ